MECDLFKKWMTERHAKKLRLINKLRLRTYVWQPKPRKEEMSKILINSI
jgi:hypothetical protein